MTPLDLAGWAQGAVGGSMVVALPVALLAGLVQNPTANNPVQNPTAGLQRRNVVINRMAALDVITDAEAAKAAEARAKTEEKVERATRAPARRASNRQTPMEALTKSVLRTAGSTLTRELMRGLLGGLKRR